MSISLDTSTNSGTNTGSPTSRSWTHVVGSSQQGRILIVTMSTGEVVVPTSIAVTYNGIAMSNAVTNTDDAYKLYAGIFYLVNPTAGSNTVAASWYGGVSGCGFSSLSLYGVSRSQPCYLSSAISQSGTAGPVSNTVPVLPGGWAIDVVAQDVGDDTVTIGAGQTSLLNTSSWRGHASYEPWSSGSTIDMTWTKSGTPRRTIASGISLVPGTAGHSPAISPSLRF